MIKTREPLKKRFLDAVNCGELGTIDDYGVVVTVREFKLYFRDIKTDYIGSFLPAASIEEGQTTATHTKYLFHIRKGVYRVHPDALEIQSNYPLNTNHRFVAKQSVLRL